MSVVTTTNNIPASKVLDALRRNRVDVCVSVPDWVQLALHHRLADPDNGIEQIFCCNEDQALAVATGLYLCGRRPVIMIQNQGLYGCVNTVRGIGLDAQLPLVMLIGQFGREEANFGQPTATSRRNPARLLEPVLQALGVRFWNLENDADLCNVDAAFEHAHQHGAPVALNVGAPLAWA
jgi:sulfopyruvate decarboxylase TPP-binding subunit